MCFITPSTTCELCQELLGERPFLTTPWQPFGADPLLRRFHRVVMHRDCAAVWPERERFSRPCYLSALAGCWTGNGTVLHATQDWFLYCEPTWRELGWRFPNEFPADLPSFAEVYIATWPSSLRADRREWASYVDTDFRDSVAGAALAQAEAVMAQVRKVAPSAEALEQLRLSNGRVPGENRTCVDFGHYLATFWPDAAAGTNWALFDEERRILEREREAERRDQAEVIEASNVRSRRLVIELLTGKALQCPHCEGSTREMRFIDPGRNDASYFICGLCARSFSGSEAPTSHADELPD